VTTLLPLTGSGMAAVFADSNQNQNDTNFSTAAASIYISALPYYYSIHMHYVLYCKSFNEKLAGVDPEQHKHYSYKYQGPSFRETNSDEYMSLAERQ
jgi:hypothetical protein